MIRPATHIDLNQLMVLGAAMHRESNYAPIQYDARRAAAFIGALIENPDGFAYVSEHDARVTGFMFALAWPAWFGNGREKIASDLVLYVEPHSRHSAAAILLATAFKDWALRMPGMRQLRPGTAAGAAGQAANAIYEFLGFEAAGKCFVLDTGEPHDHLLYDDAAAEAARSH